MDAQEIQQRLSSTEDSSRETIRAQDLITIMILKKGSKVEVLAKREVPCGSWCCAEIVSGDGRYYSVKYDCYSEETGVTVERVSRKVIRPCPPPVVSPRCWVPGDIVEVFEKNSWKLAEVSRVVGANYFFVRLLGSSRKLRAHISNLRMRLVWEDNKWVVIQKESAEFNNGITDSQPRPVDFSNEIPQSCIEAKTCPGGDQFSKKYDNRFCELCLGSKKRRRLYLPQINTCTGAHKKMRSVEETGREYRLLETVSSHLLGKVDVGASSQTIPGAEYMHTSLNYRTSGFCETEMDERKPDADVGYNFVGCLAPNDAKSTFSSVGSCSAGSGPYRPLRDPMTGQTHGMDSLYNDTASCHGSGGEPSLPMKEGLPEEIHCLELNAYRSTMMALYAFGSLNWEQEILLTNLRLTLHISNDEHLLELKHLRSAINRYLS